MIVVFQSYKNFFTSAPREPGSPGKVPVPAVPYKTKEISRKIAKN